jgi:hypothetical protein
VSSLREKKMQNKTGGILEKKRECGTAAEEEEKRRV